MDSNFRKGSKVVTRSSEFVNDEILQWLLKSLLADREGLNSNHIKHREFEVVWEVTDVYKLNDAGYVWYMCVRYPNGDSQIGNLALFREDELHTATLPEINGYNPIYQWLSKNSC